MKSYGCEFVRSRKSFHRQRGIESGCESLDRGLCMFALGCWLSIVNTAISVSLSLSLSLAALETIKPEKRRPQIPLAFGNLRSDSPNWQAALEFRCFDVEEATSSSRSPPMSTEQLVC